MALPAAKKVSLSLAVVVILLFFSAASFYFYFSVYARNRSYGIGTQKMQSSTWESKKEEKHFRGSLSLRSLGDKTDQHEYQSYYVLLWKHPDGDEAMGDDKDARRRWYESFLPSTHTDDGERRLLLCEASPDNGFAAVLTRDEARALADKPGIRRMYFESGWGPYITWAESCGFETTGSNYMIQA